MVCNELINAITSNINNINKYNWDILYTCEDPIILCELLFQWLQDSIEYVIDPKNISEMSNDLSDYQQILKTCEFQTLLLINKFLKLIKSSSEPEEETELEKKEFIQLLSRHLLGYSHEELKKEEMENIEKLSKLIDFIGQKEKTVNINLKVKEEDSKDILLSNLYEQLKEYFENKKGNEDDNKKINIANYMSRENLYKTINNIMSNNNINIKSAQISNEDTIKSDKKEENNKDNLNRDFSSGKLYKVSRLGIITANNRRNYLNKSFKSNASNVENKNALLTSYKVIDEVEEEKDIPWIREEDC